MDTCRCFSVDATEHDGSLTTFAHLRDECAALKEILIPDCIWPEYRDFCAADPDEACHAPIAYLAFKRQRLTRLTEPIHLFCLQDVTPHPSLTSQYRKDLAERWMFTKGVKQRFQRSRKFQGRLAELLFPAWLHHKGWRIEALEALGGGTDVVATEPLGESFCFEVKHLGQEEVFFDLGVQALSGDGVSYGGIPVYSPIDYLIYRVFEAARQLSSCDYAGIVVMILAEYDVYFNIPLSGRWIDWLNPRFFRKEVDIESFLQKKYASNPNLDQDMKHYISRIDQIWFYDVGTDFVLRRRQIEKVRGP